MIYDYFFCFSDCEVSHSKKGRKTLNHEAEMVPTEPTEW